MTLDKPLAKTSLLIVVATLSVAAVLSLSHHEKTAGGRLNDSESRSRASAFFSPGTDLEAKDIEVISNAKIKIDIAMYSFTDRQIESAVLEAAERGVKVRIIRDGVQYRDEAGRALRTGEPPVTDRLRGRSNIEVRVKSGGQLMHLKAYCVDEAVLRTGSANWSPRGETEQSNDLELKYGKDEVMAFEQDFERLWSLPGNQVL